jgi:ABC-type oligopeptide transport system substrate-binding subunit
MSRKASVRFCVSVVVAALLLTGCNANQAINASGQARCANDSGCDPYNPISYAQNNTGNAGGGR